MILYFRSFALSLRSQDFCINWLNEDHRRIIITKGTICTFELNDKQITNK